MRLFSIGGYGLALAALTLVVFGAIECPSFVSVMFVCCCVRFRIPRTKQQIEADYVRKQITRKFQKQLRRIQNADMDEMDLKSGNDPSVPPLAPKQRKVVSVYSVGSSGPNPRGIQIGHRESGTVGGLIRRRQFGVRQSGQLRLQQPQRSAQQLLPKSQRHR